MRAIAKFIVQKRILFFVLFAALIVYCAIGIPKVNVEYDISMFLPPDTDTKKAIDIMEDEFVTYGTTTVLVKNITYDSAERLHDRIEKVDGVKSFAFDDGEDCYKDAYAKFSITFDGDADDERAVNAYNAVIKILDDSGYAYVVPTPLVDDYADTLASEMLIIIAIAAAVIILVLLFTSKSFAEILAFPVVFIVAAVLNMGTNQWLGTISFVSNTVCIILQLALAIDYAIILCHRFTEEKDKGEGSAEDAMIIALSKAIPEISSSSLTTVSGLVALMFMQLKLGYDLGLVLAKSIICSLITVFLLMPGLLMLLTKLMDKSRHRNFVPKIKFWGSGVIKARYVLMPVFAILFAVGATLSQQVTYVYSTGAIDTSRPTETRIAQEQCQDVFGYDTMFVILVPKGDYEAERRVLDLVESDPLVDSATGISNIEIRDGFYLSDSINYRDFNDMTDIGLSLSMNVFRMYALINDDYWAIQQSRIEEYRVTVIELLDFVFDHDDYLDLSGEDKEDFDKLKDTLKDGEAQLIGNTYSRLIFNVSAPVESAETFAMIERLTPTVKEIYPSAIFAGESMSSYDLNSSFSSDNLLINLLTVAFIFLILMFTFRSWGIPIVLVFVIQGAIFLNFSIPVLAGSNLFFFTYLIVSAIQMGATIDYAILLTNRFRQLKSDMPKREAMIEAVSGAFPTVFTSGSIMCVAGFLVGLITSDPLIASMGMCLGEGTLISIFCVMLFLPAFLYTFDGLLDKTVFKRRVREPKEKKKNILSSLVTAVRGIQVAIGELQAKAETLSPESEAKPHGPPEPEQNENNDGIDNADKIDNTETEAKNGK